jgi:hypothetical protein
MLTLGGPVSLAHELSHQAEDAYEAQHVLVVADAAQDGADGQSLPSSGLHYQHCHACPCLQAFPTRSLHVAAYPDGARIHYIIRLNDDAPKFAPSPLRKPPRNA